MLQTNNNRWVYDYTQILAGSFNYPVAGAKSIGVGRWPAKMGNSSQLIILVIGVRVSRADELQRSSIGSQFN